MKCKWCLEHIEWVNNDWAASVNDGEWWDDICMNMENSEASHFPDEVSAVQLILNNYYEEL